MLASTHVESLNILDDDDDDDDDGSGSGSGGDENRVKH